jgi:hypothetical protein
MLRLSENTRRISLADDRTLLRWQRNEVFHLIQASKLDPARFSWKEKAVEGDKISRLLNKETSFFFDFGAGYSGGKLYWVCTFMPTGDRRIEKSDWCDVWPRVLKFVQEWLSALAKEISAPDLWAALASEGQLVRTAAGQFDDNAPFTPPEKIRIAQVIHELKEHLLRTVELSADQLKFIDARLGHLEDAAGRLGRKDWTTLAMGALTSIIIGAALPPDSARELFSLAGRLLAWIVEVARALP